MCIVVAVEMHKDRSKSASSMDSFNLGDELASLEDRLKMKLTPSDCLSFVSYMIHKHIL